MQNNLLMPGIIHFADRLIVNKIDLVPGEDDLSRIESRLRQINRFAPIIRTSNSSVSAENVLDLKGRIPFDQPQP